MQRFLFYNVPRCLMHLHRFGISRKNVFGRHCVICGDESEEMERKPIPASVEIYEAVGRALL